MRAHLTGTAPVQYDELEVMRNLIRALGKFRTLMSPDACRATTQPPMEQILRTVRRTPDVKVKVSGIASSIKKAMQRCWLLSCGMEVPLQAKC